ncbi:MAG: metal-dependent transcriptional regulator [Acholeplasmatales bacterium]|nr:metal-dependent transcriptional regulator [Acholeplasmatales bacterium]
MSLLESGENYLEAILMISERKKDVHAIDVVNELKFSKPSVSIMLKKLRDNGYIIIDENNHLHLTDEGMKIATKIYERHKILTAILKKLGVSDELAEEDACKIEHDLSDETWDKVRLYYKNKFEK